MAGYPQWFFYPSHQAPPEWVRAFVRLLSTQREQIDSTSVQELTSDRVLSLLADGLTKLGYAVETGKRSADKIRRPVLFGDQGVERGAYEVDAFHDELGVAVEIEARRGARGNAIYRDLVRTSLIVGARFLALGVMAGKGTSTPDGPSPCRAIETPRTNWMPSTRVGGLACRSRECCSSGTSQAFDRR